MAKITKPVSPVVVALRAANAAGNTMVARCRDAAVAAAKEYPDGTVGERNEKIQSIYADAIKACDVNVRVVFRAALLCALAPAEEIELEAPKETADGATPAVVKKAGDIATKHAMVEAAKQIRETFGFATSGKKGATKASSPVVAASDGFGEWVAKLVLYMQDADHKAIIEQHLTSAGYKLTKAKAVGKPSATASQINALAAMVEGANEKAAKMLERSKADHAARQAA